MKTNMYQFGETKILIVNIERIENITIGEGQIKFWMFGGQELSAYYSNMDVFDEELVKLYKLLNVEIVLEEADK